jgi:predicted transcriptional regulator
MGITPAAVTYYINGLRGNTAMDLIDRSAEALKIIDKIASDLANGKPPTDVLENICEVCLTIRASGSIFQFRLMCYKKSLIYEFSYSFSQSCCQF